jgi:hypothetical protein
MKRRETLLPKRKSWSWQMRRILAMIVLARESFSLTYEFVDNIVFILWEENHCANRTLPADECVHGPPAATL